VLEEMILKCKTEAIFACGPHPMLAAVSAIAAEVDIPVQVAVEELMACGYGVCMTCVMPLRRQPEKDEAPEDAIVYARSCTEGPVFNGAKIVWDGAGPLVSLDQSELAPVGAPSRQSLIFDPEDEYAPPGN
jgi:dihydroorotate dehydrogenase electron transfer subunit